jgi:hypothetical protein
MAGTPLGWGVTDGGTSWAAASWSTTLLGLSNNSSSVSPSIDNTPATIGASAYDEGFLQIYLGSTGLTLSTTVPYSVAAVPLDSQDGTNYTPSYVSGSTLFPLDRQRVQTFPASSTVNYIHIRGILLYPFNMKIAIINTLGQAFPSSGVTATFYRLRRSAG